MTRRRNIKPFFRTSGLAATVLFLLPLACGQEEPVDHSSQGVGQMASDTASMTGDEHAGMDHSSMAAAETSNVVRIEPSVIQTIGVRTTNVEIAPLRKEIRSTGRFEMDESGAHTVTLRTSGWVEKLYVNYEGALVKKGDPLLELYSPDLVATQEEYLLALNNVRRMAQSPIPGMAQDAERLLEAARRRLLFWNITEEQIKELEESGKPTRTLRFTVPVTGEVMSKSVVEGQHIDAGQPLLEIYDLSRIWLIADIYEQDLPWVKEGLPVQIELPYDPGRAFNGRVEHIYYMLDPSTRTARARIVMPGQRTLKPGMYATVRIQSAPLAPSPVVPEEAVIRTGAQDIVIIALGEGRFERRAVKLGVLADGRYQVLQGLAGQEVVVTSAQFLIDSESRLKGAVGAMSGHQH